MATDLFYLLLWLYFLPGERAQGNFSVERSFTCAGNSDLTIIDLNNTAIRNISLLSPCYPDSYRSCEALHKCTITLLNIPIDMWVEFKAYGEFNNMSDDLIEISWAGGEQGSHTGSELEEGLRFVSRQQNNNSLSVTLSPDEVDSSADEMDNFKLEIIFAYILGGQYGGDSTVEHSGGGGYIVSHEQYDAGHNEDNNYDDGLDEQLTLKDLPNRQILQLTFLEFDLHRSSNPFYLFCDDYLKVFNIRGSDRYFCGYDDPTNEPTQAYASGKSMTLRFVTRTLFLATNSAGFLIKYEVIDQGINDCPPSIQNAQTPVPADEKNKTFTIECSSGYWIDDQTHFQTVNCSSNRWRQSLLSCTVIECSLDVLINQTFNFTMSTSGRATIGTTATYFSKGYPVKYGVATCMPDGQWNISDLGYLPTDMTTEATTTTVTPGSGPDSGERFSPSPSPSPSVAAYVGGGVAGIILVAIIAIILVLLYRRRRQRTKNPKPASSPTLPVHSSKARNSPTPTPDEPGLYCLADEIPEVNQTAVDSSTEAYELAGQELPQLPLENPKAPNKGESESFLTDKAPNHDGLVYSLAGEEQTNPNNLEEQDENVYYDYQQGLIENNSNSASAERMNASDENTPSPQPPTTGDRAAISMIDNELYES